MITSPYFLQEAGNVQVDPLLNSFVAVKSAKSPLFMELRAEGLFFVRYKKDGVYVKEQYLASVRNLYVEADPGTEVRLYGSVFFVFSCRQNQVTEFYAKDQEELQDLALNNNLIKTLDLSELSDLVNLSVSDNNLTSLILPKAKGLMDVSCFDNLLTSLDLSGNEDLMYLDCWSNSLVSLNVDGCTNLQRLSCYGNMLQDLRLGSAAEALQKLEAQNNRLEGILDFSDYLILTDLKLQQNLLTGVVLPLYMEQVTKRAALLYNNPFSSDAEASELFIENLETLPAGTTGYSISINGTQSKDIQTAAVAKNWKVTIHA